MTRRLARRHFVLFNFRLHHTSNRRDNPTLRCVGLEPVLSSHSVCTTRRRQRDLARARLQRLYVLTQIVLRAWSRIEELSCAEDRIVRLHGGAVRHTRQRKYHLKIFCGSLRASKMLTSGHRPSGAI